MARALRALWLWIGLAGVAGCATLPTSPAPPPDFSDGRAGHFIEGVLPVAQRAYQCGPAALESVLGRWGRPASADEITRSVSAGSRGILNFALVQAAQDRGFWTEVHMEPSLDLREWIRRDIPPIVLLHVAPLGIPVYHFAVLRGFHDERKIFYINEGHAETRAIRMPAFAKRWKEAGYWTLILCPPERVDWALSPEEAVRLGLLLEQQGRLDLAESRYRSALEKDPQGVTSRFNLANVFWKTGRRAEAKKIYQQLFKEQPGWAPAANNLAWLWLEEGKPEQARRVLETALQKGAERNYELLDTLGLAYGRLRRPAEAFACFNEALKKVPPGQPERERLIRAHQAEFQGF